MNIALDVSPLEEKLVLGHRVRGTGFYIKNLKSSLLQYFPKNNYTFFSRGDSLPEDVDIVHYPYFEPFFLTLPSKKVNRTIVTVHDLTPFVFPDYFKIGVKGRIKWLLQKRALKNADAIITDSQSSKNDVIKYTGIPESKISVVYLAAGEEFKRVEISKLKVESLRKKYNLPEKFTLYVGDVTWNKNLPRLVNAIKKTDIPLVMVGKALTIKNFNRTNSWNQDLGTVQEQVMGDKRFVLPGFVKEEDLKYLYSMATVFVMPSLYEGFGLPILEAMGCGCPVVTSRRGSLGEVAGDAAYYIDPENIENIAKGIKDVFSNKKLRMNLIEKGIQQAKRFSWQKTALETVKVYEKIFKS